MDQPPLGLGPRDPFPGAPQLVDERIRRTEAQTAEQNVALRAWYAKSILIGLGVEAAASLVALFGVGFRWLHLSPWVADAFLLPCLDKSSGSRIS